MEKIFQIYEKSKIENKMKEKSLLELIQKDIMDNVYRMELNYDNTKRFEHLLQKRIRQYKVVNNIDGNAPFYKHDCSKCTYLGDYIKSSFETKEGLLHAAYFDLYVHPQFENNSVVFIARYGNELDEYTSFTYFVEAEWKPQQQIMEQLPEIYEAFKRYGKRCRPNPPKNYPFSFLDIE